MSESENKKGEVSNNGENLEEKPILLAAISCSPELRTQLEAEIEQKELPEQNLSKLRPFRKISLLGLMANSDAIIDPSDALLTHGRVGDVFTTKFGLENSPWHIPYLSATNPPLAIALITLILAYTIAKKQVSDQNVLDTEFNNSPEEIVNHYIQENFSKDPVKCVQDLRKIFESSNLKKYELNLAIRKDLNQKDFLCIFFNPGPKKAQVENVTPEENEKGFFSKLKKFFSNLWFKPWPVLVHLDNIIYYPALFYWLSWALFAIIGYNSHGLIFPAMGAEIFGSSTGTFISYTLGVGIPFAWILLFSSKLLFIWMHENFDFSKSHFWNNYVKPYFDGTKPVWEKVLKFPLWLSYMLAMPFVALFALVFWDKDKNKPTVIAESEKALEITKKIAFHAQYKHAEDMDNNDVYYFTKEPGDYTLYKNSYVLVGSTTSDQDDKKSDDQRTLKLFYVGQNCNPVEITNHDLGKNSIDTTKIDPETGKLNSEHARGINKKIYTELLEEKNEAPVNENSQEAAPSTSFFLPPQEATPTEIMRFFWINFVSRLVKFEYQGWFIMAAMAYLKPSLTDLADTILGGKTFYVVSILILAFSFLHAVRKTHLFINGKDDYAKRRNLKADDLEAENNLHKNIADLKKKISQQKDELSFLKLKSNIDIPDPDIPDATVPKNTLDLKRKNRVLSATEAFLRNPYWVTFSAVSCYFLYHLFTGRIFFVAGTGMTTFISEAVLSKILGWAGIPLSISPEGVIFLPASIAFAAVLIYTVIHGLLLLTQKNQEVKDAAKKQQIDHAADQKVYLENELKVRQKHFAKFKALSEKVGSPADPNNAPNYSDTYPDPDLTNFAKQRNWQNRIIYFLAGSSLAGLLGLFLMPLIPAFSSFLSLGLVLKISVPVIATNIFALFLHSLSKNSQISFAGKITPVILFLGLIAGFSIIAATVATPFAFNIYVYFASVLTLATAAYFFSKDITLSRRERNITLSLLLSLGISFTLLVMFYAIPALGTVSNAIYFSFIPVFLAAAFFGTTFKKEYDDISLAKEFLERGTTEELLSEWENTPEKILQENEKESASHMITLLLNAMNPRGSGEKINAAHWSSENDKNPEEEMRRDFSRLENFLKAIKNDECVSTTELAELIKRGKTALKSGVQSAQESTANEKPLAKNKEQFIESVSMIFLMLAYFIMISLPAALSLPNWVEWVAIIPAPFAFGFRLLFEKLGYKKAASFFSIKALTSLLLAGIALGTITIPFMLNANASLPIIIALSALIPLFLARLALKYFVTAFPSFKNWEQRFKIPDAIVLLSLAILLPAAPFLLAATVSTTLGFIMLLCGLPASFFIFKVLLPKVLGALHDYKDLGEKIAEEKKIETYMKVAGGVVTILGPSIALFVQLLFPKIHLLATPVLWPVIVAWGVGLMVGHVGSALLFSKRLVLAGLSEPKVCPENQPTKNDSEEQKRSEATMTAPLLSSSAESSFPNSQNYASNAPGAQKMQDGHSSEESPKKEKMGATRHSSSTNSHSASSCCFWRTLRQENSLANGTRLTKEM